MLQDKRPLVFTIKTKKKQKRERRRVVKLSFSHMNKRNARDMLSSRTGVTAGPD